MDQNEEYHDPDYPESTVQIKEEVPELLQEQKIEKIKSIIRREFTNELEKRENEVLLIDQRMSTARRLLQKLRYSLVSSYYRDSRLQITKAQVEDDVAAQTEPRVRAEVAATLRDGQNNIHPSVRKLLGKKTVDINEIFMSRPLRNISRKDYSAMIQKRNYTIAADTTKSLRPDHKHEPEKQESEASCSKPKKVPRHLEPKNDKVLTLDDPTRNKMKHRYRLIVGNTSKYAPAMSRLDRSTHQWLLYVRGPPPRPDPSPILTRVVARLHASYAPHHTVHLHRAPFHVSRRGWGEFPALLELHFPLPAVNRPATLEHNIKLDRNYTGLQTLGAETVVDIWLYSTPEMLQFEYVDSIPNLLAATDEQTNELKTEQTGNQIDTLLDHIKHEPEDTNSYSDNWTEFFSKDTTELDVDEMIIKPVKKTPQKNAEESERELVHEELKSLKTEPLQTPEPEEIQYSPVKKRIMKYIDATTGKIYYLEMDRNLDLSKVQEIVINNNKTAKISPIKSNGLKSVRKKKGVSLLKPEVTNQLKCDTKQKPLVNTSFSHIENDHCYLQKAWPENLEEPMLHETDVSFEERSVYERLCYAATSFSCVRMAVNYMCKMLPVITESAKDSEFVSQFPFVVDTEEKYWKLDFAKRRNIEWTRAKIINRILMDHFKHKDSVWRTKQILIYTRLHGYHPIRAESVQKQPESEEWSSWHDIDSSRKSESNIKEMYPNPADISSLSLFNSDDYLKDSSGESETNSDTDEVIDVLCSELPLRVKEDVLPEVVDNNLTVLPVESDEDRLRFMFIERKCADIGVELKNEDVGNGCSYSAVHAVLLSAVKSYAEELIRCSLAEKLLEDIPEDTSPPVWIGSSSRASVFGAHVFAALARASKFASSSRALASKPHRTHAL